MVNSRPDASIRRLSSKSMRLGIAAVFAAYALLITSSAAAETYKDIGFFDSLGDLKTKFPNAKFTQLKPGWAQDADLLYSITGPGMIGTIVVKFHDGRVKWRKDLANETDESKQSALRNLLTNMNDDSPIVEWVRWVPPTPIPLARFIAKYGQPEKSGFTDEDLQPYRHWVAKGLRCFLSDDEKMVSRVDYVFTRAEMRTSAQERLGSIPDWLKEPTPNESPPISAQPPTSTPRR